MLKTTMQDWHYDAILMPYSTSSERLRYSWYNVCAIHTRKCVFVLYLITIMVSVVRTLFIVIIQCNNINIFLYNNSQLLLQNVLIDSLMLKRCCPECISNGVYLTPYYLGWTYPWLCMWCGCIIEFCQFLYGFRESWSLFTHTFQFMLYVSARRWYSFSLSLSSLC